MARYLTTSLRVDSDVFGGERNVGIEVGTSTHCCRPNHIPKGCYGDVCGGLQYVMVEVGTAVCG